MEELKGLIWNGLTHASEEQLLFLERITQKKGILEKVDAQKLQRYIQETDFNKLDVKGRPICLIEYLDWEFPFFTFYFFNNVVANIAYCLYKGFRPYVGYLTHAKSYSDDNQNLTSNVQLGGSVSSCGVNLWEMFMLQPYGTMLVPGATSIVCRYKFAPVGFPNFPDDQERKRLTNLYSFFRPKPKVIDYFIAEYESLLRGKRVLGVLCRGTDYMNSWIEGLAKQPTAEQLIDEVRSRINKLRCKYIYLATEEEAAFEKFNAAFPGMVITNQRRYYGERYYSKRRENDHLLISNISNERKNDGYYRYLEYLSSINLLSKCNALIAGSCGGSRAALYLNKGRYEYVQLINIGTF